ncbi:RabGAP/TBC [Hesseltinella vesiculosa]|uniref:RabGAP/TBC n=1 Tax=Hesseltinella vesiculosa TaxID=101127 RepID=A0A1X2GEM8_9FUNG|nr:RabGAP/TBC [Hesseltinella vesiculosa]
MNLLQTKREAWDVIFKDAQLTEVSLRKRGLVGAVCENGLRSVCWKVYLQYLPSLDLTVWPDVLHEERHCYYDLRRKYIEEPAEMMRNKNGDGDVTDNNPLALNESNPWQQYFADAEIRKIIRQDVERTFPDVDFFRSSSVQEQMTDILFIYCKIHEDVSYRQGMHELLAPIYWVVADDSLADMNQEMRGNAQLDPTNRLMVQVLDPDYIEHDAYILFNKLMTFAKPWYELTPTEPINRSKSTSDLAEASKTGQMSNPIVNTCQRIQNQYLRAVDFSLYKHLNASDIEPQLYGIRWLRLLFGREFEFHELLKLWDSIFSQDPTLQIVDYICVAMLLRLHDQLIEGDYAECLTLLMRGIRINQPKTLVEQANYLQQHMNADGGLQILRQNDIRQGKEPRPSISPDQSPLQPRLVPSQHTHPTSPPLDSFSNFTRGVINSPQVRDINKAIAGVVGTVQKNVNIIGDNMRQALQDEQIHRRQRATSSSASQRPFSPPQTAPRAKPLPPFQRTPPLSATETLQQLQLANRQMGNVMSQCISVLEKEIFEANNNRQAEPQNTPSDNPLEDEQSDNIKNKDEASVVLVMAGLKHIRDVLLGKQPRFDKNVLQDARPNDQHSTLVDSAGMAAKPLPLFQQKPPVQVEAEQPQLTVASPPISSTSKIGGMLSSKASYTIDDLLADPSLQTKESQTNTKFAWMDESSTPSTNKAASPQGIDHLNEKSVADTKDSPLFQKPADGLASSPRSSLHSRKQSSATKQTAPSATISRLKESAVISNPIDPLDARNVDARPSYEYDEMNF